MTAPANRHALRRALHVLANDGWRVFALKLLGELGYRRLLLLECSLAGPPPPVSAAPALPCALLPESEIDDYLQLRPEAQRADVLARLRDGCLCFVARRDGRVVAACWSRRSGARIDWVDYAIPLAEGDAYLFDAYTAPAARGRGIAGVLCRFQLRQLRDAGCLRAVRGTLPENTPALRAHRKSGFLPFAMITRLRLGPWRRTVRRPWSG